MESVWMRSNRAIVSCASCDSCALVVAVDDTLDEDDCVSCFLVRHDGVRMRVDDKERAVRRVMSVRFIDSGFDGWIVQK